MGDRANIQITDSDNEEDADIYLYTHWHGTELPNILARALDRGIARWGDRAYLTRIIFSEMIQHEILSDTGYGIAPYKIDNGPLYIVDMAKNTVTSSTNAGVLGPVSFVEFIKLRQHYG